MRGGPINTRRVALPQTTPNKQVGQDLQNLMLKNKDQILEKIPKNGQVTVLLFREGDKVNVYHVLEKPDGSFSPLSNAQSPLSSPEDHDEWSSSGPSIKRLLEHSDSEENPIIKQRLKENAVTMNKMSELRTQLENLSMLKKNKRRNVTKKRPKSHRKSNNVSRQSKWSASTNYSSKNGSTLPLPPIGGPPANTKSDSKDVLPEKDEDFCTIQPLNRKHIKKEMSNNKVPDWLKKNEGHYHHAKTFPIRHKGKQNETESAAPNNIDLVDLQFRPDNASLEMTNHRKAQKLISTDLSNVVLQDSQPKQGRLQRQTSSCSIKSKTRLNLSSSGRDSASPRTKAEIKQKWLKKPKPELERPETTSTMPLSESRDSLAFTSVTDQSDGLLHSIKKTNSPLLPLRSASRSSKGSNGRQSGRPKFVANTLNVNKKKVNKMRCFTCNKKINITNTFSCRCNKSFCPKHRHPELHSCTFDYRSEGRKQLEQANPVVMLPKLPKI